MTANTVTETSTEVSAPQRIRRPSWRRRLRLVALVLVAAVAGTLIQGNILLVGMSWLARGTTDLDAGPDLEGVRKLYNVDDRVWRGAQPGLIGFRSLAERGVTTVVDLRPGSAAYREDDELRALGLEPVHLPVTDGRPPAASQVREFIAIVRTSKDRKSVV